MKLKAVFLIFIFWALGGMAFLLHKEAAALIMPIAAFSILFFIYYIISEDLWQEILGNVLLGFVFLLLAAVPVIGWILFAGWVIYNISKAIDGIKSIFPDAIFSIFLYLLLFSENLFSIDEDLMWLPLSVYAVSTAIYSVSISNSSLKDAVFRISTMWLSCLFIVLMISSIFASLRSLFSFSSSRVMGSVRTTQNVSGYTRADGTFVDGYTRGVSMPVENIKVQFNPDAGSIRGGVNFKKDSDDD